MDTSDLFAVKDLMSAKRSGVLSTHSLDMPGFPFGSLVAYCLDKDGDPLIQLSALAQHTKNLAANPKVSLTVTDVKGQDVQNARRVTFLAEAQKIGLNDPDTQERYYRAFPSAREYGQTLDFSFYRLKLVRLRYIGGFGKIFWVEPSDYHAAVRRP